MWEVILTSTVVSTLVLVIWELIKNKLDFKQEKQLQIDNFYREVSGGQMHYVLEKWSNLLFNGTNEEIENVLKSKRNMNKLLHETYIFSYSETIKRLSNFQQYIYKSEGENDPYVIMVLIAGIINSLKYDFTGEEVGVKELLRIKITDVDAHIDTIKKTMKLYDYK